MQGNLDYPLAMQPEHLRKFFIDRANAGDVAGLVALYEPDAVLVAAPGVIVHGVEAIRRELERLVARMISQEVTFSGIPSPALLNGELALTSTRFTTFQIDVDGQPTVRTSITVGVARRQPSGEWRWVIDQPNIIGRL